MDTPAGQRSHQPKGRMCASCVKQKENCSGLRFEAMPVILIMPGGVKVVRCTEYARLNASLSRQGG